MIFIGRKPNHVIVLYVTCITVLATALVLMQ